MIILIRNNVEVIVENEEAAKAKEAEGFKRVFKEKKTEKKPAPKAKSKKG